MKTFKYIKFIKFYELAGPLLSMDTNWAILFNITFFGV